MRRAVVAVIVGGFACGGIGSGLGLQPGITGASRTADARPSVTGARLTAAVKPVPKTSHGSAQAKIEAKAKAKAKAEIAAKNQARAKGKSNVKTGATKAITYDGLVFKVPAAWPVYWLDQHPDQCIRYDINAVYVGIPGNNQDCPADLVGRADTISIGAPSAPNTGPPNTGPQKTPAAGKGPARTEQRSLIDGQPVTGPSVAPGTVVENPNLRELAVAMPASLPWIEATYGTDPGLVEQALDTFRDTGSVRLTRAKHPEISIRYSFSGRVRTARTKPAPLSGAATAQATAQASSQATVWPWPPDTTTPTPTPTTTPTSTATPTSSPTATSSPTPTPSVTSPGASGTPSPSPRPSTSPTVPVVPKPSGSALAGFDTCTAPSLSTMKAWRAKYAATAIYIGGQEMACDYGNLSASWVHQTEAAGWSLMPIFVGLQAPCDSFSGQINPAQAAAQGTAAANQAVGNAGSFGLGAGSPIYYDMEGYDRTNASCRTAVLTFLDAWDRQLTARGYVSGVYSSADAAVYDLQHTTAIAGHALAEPQAIWFALWDNATNLTGSPYMTAAVWPQTSRSKQYAGNQNVTVGGVSLNIDADLVHGQVARG